MTPAGIAWLPVKRAATLLALTAFLLYIPTLFQSFFADDDVYLAFRNTLLRDTEWSKGYLLLIQRANPWEYLPLRDLSYWLDFRIYKTEGTGFHFSNLLWYALSALGFGLMTRQLILLLQPAWVDRATTLAWCGAALFLVHPAHVEAVAWVASRKDLMSGTFAFFSCFVLVRGIRTQAYLGGSLLAALLLLMACFSKAASITIVIFQIALIISTWRMSAQTPDKHKLVALALLLLTATLAAVVHAQMGASTGIRIENSLPPMETIERGSRILAALQGLLWVPYPMGIYHDVYAYNSWHWLASGVSLLFTVLALIALATRPTLWACGIVLMLAPCTVYLQFMPYTTWSLASERFIFVSVAGAALILIDIFGRLQSRTALALLLGLFIPCAFVTWERIADWEFPTTLREKEYERLPEFHNAIRDRIDTLQARGDEASMSEAARLTSTIKRPYAADALLKQLAAAQAFRRLGNWQDREDRILMSSFCQSLASLRKALATGHMAMRHEPDVSYNNLLTSIEWDLKINYTSVEAHCKNR